MRLTAESLAKVTRGRILRASSRPIAAAFIDSRTPRPEGLFVPIVAARDGHDFIAAAIAAGASAVVQMPGRPLPDGDVTVVEVDDTVSALTDLGVAARERIDGPVVAITGSNGKTTTRAMVEAVLRSSYESVLSTRGNFNNHLGVPLSLLDEPHDPDAAVLELGMSAPGENDRLAAIVRPTIGIITSIALEHLEFMGSLAAIADAEAELVPHVDPAGALVIPADEMLLSERVPAGYRPQVLRIGPDAGADVRVVSVEVGVPTKAILALRDGRTLEFRLRTFGAHNARNAAAALAVGCHLGLDPEAMKVALESVEPVGDRGRVHVVGPHVLIADCYNANPGSMEVALRSLAAMRGHHKIAVLGDMLELGPTEVELHEAVGRLCAGLAIDVVYGFGARARAIVDGARGCAETRNFDEIDVIVDALRARLAAPEPVAVLFKGSRGMKLERVVAALLDLAA